MGVGRVWLGIGISVALLALFFLTVDLGRMVDALVEADYLFVLPGVALYLMSVLFRTIRWQVLLRHLRPVSVRRLYPVVVVGYMANNLLPMRVGELVRSYYLGEREGISKTSALVTIFIERIFDALTLLFFVAVVAMFVPIAGLAESFAARLHIPWPVLVTLFSAPFVLTTVALVLFAYRPAILWSVMSGPLNLLPDRFEHRVRLLLDRCVEGIAPLRSPGTLGLLFLLSLPIWLLEAGLFVFVGLAFDLDRVYDGLGELAVVSVVVTSFSNIGSSVPAAPGGIGLFELITRETLVLMPMAELARPVAGAYAAVVHAALLLPMIVLGQIFLMLSQVSGVRLTRDAEREALSTASLSEEKGTG